MSYLLQNQLADCRAAKGMRKSQLAFRLKMTRAYVTRLERGDIRPSFETAVRIARIFGRPVEEIFQLVEEEISPACPAKGSKASGRNASPKRDFPSAFGCGQELNNAETMKG